MKYTKQRHTILTLEEVLPFIITENVYDNTGKQIQQNKIRHDFKGYSVKMSSLRLQTFKEKGMTCVSCGTKASFFTIESVGGQTPNLELYGKDALGDDLLFTKDHIQAKSNGGKDCISNMQPMCSVCNCEKGNK